MRIDPLRDAGPVRTLEQAIDRDCRDMRGSLTAVCAILNEPYDAFQKRLSVSYPSHHLHAPDVERVIELVRGDAVRQWFERVYGVVCYQPMAVPATQDALLAFAWGWAENMAQAAMKAVPLGQAAAQRMLARLAAEIPADTPLDERTPCEIAVDELPQIGE